MLFNENIVWAIFSASFAGMCLGWVLRSLLFGLQEDCANPKHPKRYAEPPR
jgi:hypothetical protein